MLGDPTGKNNKIFLEASYCYCSLFIDGPTCVTFLGTWCFNNFDRTTRAKSPSSTVGTEAWQTYSRRNVENLDSSSKKRFSPKRKPDVPTTKSFLQSANLKNCFKIMLVMV